MTTRERRSVFDGYLRHGRHFGVGVAFWEVAAIDLDRAELARLARDLGAKLPSKWATTENGHRNPALQAGLSVDKLQSGPITRPAMSTLQKGRNARVSECGECGGPVAYLTRTGLCRRCQSRLSKRRRRAGRPATDDRGRKAAS